jgi:hypothetical protein
LKEHFQDLWVLRLFNFNEKFRSFFVENMKILGTEKWYYQVLAESHLDQKFTEKNFGLMVEVLGAVLSRRYFSLFYELDKYCVDKVYEFEDHELKSIVRIVEAISDFFVSKTPNKLEKFFEKPNQGFSPRKAFFMLRLYLKILESNQGQFPDLNFPNY